MLNKFNAERQHHIPKFKDKVRNWPQYEEGLRRRGGLTLWITDDAIDDWLAKPRLRSVGQAIHSEGAIRTCLMLRTAFKLPLRQAEGLMRSRRSVVLNCVVIRMSHDRDRSRRARTTPNESKEVCS
jgi:Transposase DDE domain